MAALTICRDPKCSKSRETLALLVRRGEDIYRTRYSGLALSDEEWIAAMIEHPVLIERPIVVAGTRAVIGRPPERVSALLDN